jgi:DNA polymerase-3 subunit epsilon
MNWFKKKSFPYYWTDYINFFKDTKSDSLEKQRFIVFDTETTGLHIDTDRILSIGAVAVVNKTIKVADQLECYIIQETYKKETVKVHGLLKEGTLKKIKEDEAIILFLKYIKNAVLVAHHADFDIAMINKCLQRMNLPKLKNKVIDTGNVFNKTRLAVDKQHINLDLLSQKFNIPQHDRHTAAGDAYITALIFVKLLHLMGKKRKDLKLPELLSRNDRWGLL